MTRLYLIFFLLAHPHLVMSQGDFSGHQNGVVNIIDSRLESFQIYSFNENGVTLSWTRIIPFTDSMKISVDSQKLVSYIEKTNQHTTSNHKDYFANNPLGDRKGVFINYFITRDKGEQIYFQALYGDSNGFSIVPMAYDGKDFTIITTPSLVSMMLQHLNSTGIRRLRDRRYYEKEFWASIEEGCSAQTNVKIISIDCTLKTILNSDNKLEIIKNLNSS